MYQVSNMGRVKGLKKNIILKPYITKGGYYALKLWKNSCKKSFYIHRLVAQAFIPNLHNLLEINHIDENKNNNCVENLEWCDRKYNANYGTGKFRTREKNRKKVEQYTLDDILIYTFNSCLEAEYATGIDNGSIGKCCSGKVKTAGGYKWRWTNDG